MTDTIMAIQTAVVEGRLDTIQELTRAAVDQGVTPQDILDYGLIPGMETVGEGFRTGSMFIPEVLRAARVMQSAVEILKPLMIDKKLGFKGRVVLGTVQGDLHDLGKNLVAIMLEGAGFQVQDLGRDISVEAIVEAVREFKPHIVGLSSLLTTTMSAMENTIEALNEAGLREGVKILVGGAPVTQAFADRIGADGFAPDSVSAVELAEKVLGSD